MELKRVVLLYGFGLEWGLKVFVVFFFKHKTAYEMRISGWSSDVCSSDLPIAGKDQAGDARGGVDRDRHRTHAGRQDRGEEAAVAGPDDARRDERLALRDRLADDAADQLLEIDLTLDEMVRPDRRLWQGLPAHVLRLHDHAGRHALDRAGDPRRSE